MGASRGFPSSTSHLFLHATACRLRRTSTPSPSRVLLCCLRWAINPSASAKTKSRSCTSTSGCATTPTAYRILCLRFARLVHHSFGSATDARLDTGGWLTLTRQGLSPRKMRRALLGAKWHILKLPSALPRSNRVEFSHGIHGNHRKNDKTFPCLPRFPWIFR